MRKSTICLAVVLMCAWVSSFGQSNGLPQWKVVKEFHVTGRTESVGPITLFTPTKQGFYRVGLYISAFTNVHQDSGWNSSVAWTDRTGLIGTILTTTDLHNGNSYSAVGPQIFSPQPGTPILFFVQAATPPPHDATYDIELNIEKLTH